MLAFTARSQSNITVAAGSPYDLECVPNIVEASVEWFIGPHPGNMCFFSAYAFMHTGLIERITRQRFINLYSLVSIKDVFFGKSHSFTSEQ